MKNALLLCVFTCFTFLSIGQVTKSDATGATLDDAIATRNFTFTSGEFGGCSSLTEVEVDLTLTVTDNSGCNAGAFGVHSDIAVSLESPSGTVVHLVHDFSGKLIGTPPILITYQDSGFPSIVNQTATYDDDAALLADDQTFFGNGTWRPQNPLSAFDGEDPAGTWILRVADGRSQGFPDFTCYIGASVRVTCGAACTDPTVPTLTHTPATVCTGGTASLNISGTLNDATAWHVYTGSCGGTQIGTTTTGTFAIPGTINSPTTYYVRGEGGCVTPGTCGTITITPQALDDASFNYSAASYCVSDSDPTPTVTGLAGGTFSSTAGLSLNASTGAIDVSASTPGTYTVTYTTAGACPNSSNVAVTINALDDASFNYSAASYCVSDSDPTPTVTGLAGGTFSSSAGLSLNASTGAIDVSASTPGTYTVSYTTAGACPNSSNVAVTINALDDPSFTYSAASYCVNDSDPTPTITGLPGGTFSSGAGLSLNASTGAIDVSVSTPGTYTVSYTTAGACPNSSNVAVTINALDDASFSYSAGTYCQTDTDPTPTITGLPGGSFSSTAGLSLNGATGAVDVSASTPGTYTVTYTTTGACPNSGNVAITVQGTTAATFTALADLCINSGVQAGLGGGAPAGGVYSGPGVTDDGNGTTYSFDPAAAGVGVHTITYTPAGGCSSAANDNVEVFAVPTVTFTAIGDICIDAGVQLVASGGSPSGGVYSGPGVTDGGDGLSYSFDPAAAGVGVHTLTYTFTNGNGCTGSANDNVEVFALPTVTLSAIGDLCVDAGVQLVASGGSPSGGVYAGPGVTDGGDGLSYSFDPAAAGVGVHTISYTFTNGNGCTSAANDNVEVFALPTVTFTAPADVCVSQGLQTGLSGGAPTGGVYSGTGVTDDGNGMTYTFDPAAAGVGTHTISYTFTNANGCTATASDDITVTSGGVVNAVCQDVIVFLDANGEATIVASDIDGGSSIGCGTLNLSASQTLFTCADVSVGPMPTNDLVISGVYDGPLTGGTPKGVELYVINDIADLSEYGLGSANNGGGTDGEEFTFPAVAATAGQYIYVASEAPQFTNWFGFAPDYTNGAMSINGDDAVELFHQGGVIDVFGDINTDGTGEVWEFQDGWAYRVNDTGNDGSVWTPSNWTFSGIDELDGETDNATAVTPFPAGTYSIAVATPTSVTLTVTDGQGGSATCTANVTVLDTISPVASCQDATVYLDATGNATITEGDVTNNGFSGYTLDQSGTFAPLTSPITGTPVALGDDAVSPALPIGFNFDFYGNTYTDFYISSNGFMTFNSGTGSGCCSGQSIPDGANPNNLIAFAWEDLDPGNGGQPAINLIQYTTVGTAPNRVLVMEFYNVDHFPSGDNVNMQVHLYETSNIIEIHTTDMPSNGDVHTMGIENIDGTDALAVPGRNSSTTWSATNDYVAFMPITGGNTDNCGVTSETIDISTFDCSDIGTPVSVTMTVTDASGNSANCTSTVTVLDTVAPTITCPLDITQDQDAGVCSADVTIPNVATSDNCSGETIAWTVSGATTASGTGQPGLQTFAVGLSTVDLVATDASGNTANCSFNVTVNDTVAPTLPVLADSVGECSVTLATPTTTDNCSGTITGTTTDPTTVTTPGTTVVTWTFDDGAGNITTATQNVIITDAVAPTASNIDTVFAECIGDVAIDITLVDDEADNCTAAPVVAYVGDVASNGTGCNDTVTRTYSVTDDAGNSINVNQIIILNDVTPPTASNPVTLNVSCLADVPVAATSASWVTDEADNCVAPTVTWLSDVSSNGTGCNDTITRTFEVADACGNAIQVVQTIIVNDDDAPTADASTLADVVGYCDITPVTPTATDNCAGTVNGVADVTFPINTLGTTVVTWTYSDNCGNTSTQTQNVIVEQIEVGTFFAPDGITIVSSNNDSGVTFQWYNCTEDSLMTGETNQNFTPTFSADFAVIVTQDGCVDTSACVTITEVGLDQLQLDQFTMFPNPTDNGSFTIQLDASLKAVSVLDMTGRLVDVNVNLNERTVDVSKLVNGAYIVRVVTETDQQLVGTIRVH